MEFDDALLSMFLLPTKLYLLAGGCLAVAGLLWMWRRDAVSSLMASFSMPFLFWWGGVLMWAGNEISKGEYPMVLAVEILLVESSVVALLFAACAVRASGALVTGTVLANPAGWVGLLIAAVALHFHIVFSWTFYLFQHPLFEMRLLRWLSS